MNHVLLFDAAMAQSPHHLMHGWFHRFPKKVRPTSLQCGEAPSQQQCWPAPEKYRDGPLDPQIVDYEPVTLGKQAHAAQNNNRYLAHARVVGEEPGAVGKSAPALIDFRRVAYADAGAVL